MKHTTGYKNARYCTLVLLAVLITALFAGCGGQKEMAADQMWGRADATEIDVNSKIAGRVVELLVKEGDVVKKGQVMARIDKRDLETQKAQQEANIQSLLAQQDQAGAVTVMQDGTTASAVEQARTSLALREADYRRYEKLLQENAVSRQAFDSARTNYEAALASYNAALSGLKRNQVNRANEKVLARKVDQAKAALAQIMVSLDETEIRAPFDGIVTAKYVETGSMISQGTPLVAVQDPTDNWVDIKVPETKLSRYQLQQKVTLTGRDGTTKVNGIIVDISRKAEFATHRATSERGTDTDIITFNMKIQVNDLKLRPGMRFRLEGDGA